MTKWLAILVCSSVGLFFSSTIDAQELTGTLKKIKDSQTIVLGIRESSLPFSYLDDQQKPIGYSIDVCMKVVDRIKKQIKEPGLKVVMNPVTSQTRIPLMVNGTIDLECGSTTNSIERQKQVAFSVSHFVTSVRMAVKANSGIKSLDDLAGKAVVTTTGTTSDRYVKQNEKGKQIDVKNIYGKDHAESFLLLESGRAAAFVIDDVLLAGLIARSKSPKNFTIVGPALSVEPYGIMMRREDPALKKLVDDTLITAMKSGEMEKLYKKWFLAPIPPQNINMNLPLSERMREAFKNPSDRGV